MGFVSIETIWLDRICVIFGGIHNACLLILLSYQLHNRRKSIQFTRNMIAMNTLALITLFCNSLFGFIRAPVSFGVWPTELGDCTFQSAMLVVIWLSGKLSLYMVCITRLDVAFRDSYYSLGVKDFVFLYVLIAVGFIAQLITIIIVWRGIMVTQWDIKFCAPDTPDWVFFFLVSWDALVSICTLYIFVKKLYQMQASRHSVSETDQLNFWTLVTKYITLTDVSIASTMVCLLAVGITSWITFSIMDTMINSWCVVLMYSDNKNLFNRMCYCCNVYCGHKCVEGVTSSKVYKGTIDYDASTMSPKSTSQSSKQQEYILMQSLE